MTEQARNTQHDYVPALHYGWLTRFYDPLVRWTTREAAFKRALVAQAAVRPGQRVLDLGCGTATLSLALKRAQPAASVVGLDGDPVILAIARDKVRQAGVEIALDHGLSYDLPYPDRSFDRVVSSLLFHHLTRTPKRRTLTEVFRVLKPGGELHVADWGRAQNATLRAAFLVVQLRDGFATTTDNVRGLLPRFIAEAGFRSVRETRRFATPLGTLSLYVARKPGARGEGADNGA
jgi:ubiquinone/menaquinone biosynthesis C-methylase UbiE